MNKKTKQRLTILRQRIEKLSKQLAGAREQDDEPGEVERLENEIASLRDEVAQLKSQ